MDETGSLFDLPQYIARGYCGTREKSGHEIPAPLGIESGTVDARRDEIAAQARHGPERPPQPIEDRSEQSGSQGDRERGAGESNRLADPEPGRLFIDL